MTKFPPRNTGQLLHLVRAYPLAWIVVARDGQFVTSVMPLLPELGADGSIASLFGHLPLGHPQVAMLRADPRALILFQGPNAYISPAIVEKPDWAPTWNFTIAAFTVDITIVPEETDRSLRDLVAIMEETQPQPWTVEQMGPRYGDLTKHVVAFRAVVCDIDVRFKHGQDEEPSTRAGIVHSLGAHPLAAWMADTNQP